MPKIVLEHVTKKWGDFYGAKDLNFTIEDREFITLLGPSGCGKTTTLRMIAGLETPTSGRIIIGDKVVFDSESGINLSPARRDIGFLFQNYALWPHMTVYKNIRFGLENILLEESKLDKDGNVILVPDKDLIDGLKILIKDEQDPTKKAELEARLKEAEVTPSVPATKKRHLTKDEMESRIEEVLTMLKITKFRDRYPAELSGGQQQRVAIARTLATKPKVLFMDEPLSNLDAKLRGEMRTELKRLHNDTDSTFIYVTHDQLEAMSLATRICLMNDAVVNQIDPPLTVYKRPANLFVADFVGNPTMNFIPGTVTAVGADYVSVSFLGVDGLFHASEIVAGLDGLAVGKEIVLGIRPEFLPIVKKSKLSGLAYSTLPTGMETTVKIDFGGDILSAVVFGSIDYATDEKINFDIVGNGIILFDYETKANLALGSIDIVNVGEKPAEKAHKIELVAKGAAANEKVNENKKKKGIKALFEKKKKAEGKAEEKAESSSETKEK